MGSDMACNCGKNKRQSPNDKSTSQGVGPGEPTPAAPNGEGK